MNEEQLNNLLKEIVERIDALETFVAIELEKDDKDE